MTRLPPTSRKPLAVPLAMSTVQSVDESATGPSSDSTPTSNPTTSKLTPEATASPIPVHLSPENKPSNSVDSSRPHPKPSLPSPKIRLEVRDLTHPGAQIFFQNADASQIISDAIVTVISTLYGLSSGTHIPPVRSVTVVLRSMDGVAYTTGSDLDDDHKEIHFSLDYISQIPTAPSTRQRDEINGVLTHEMVHVWQWNGLGSAPGGLIEGIADFVRLKASLGPPHWQKKPGGDWDAGYQSTAYFLDWIEETIGRGKVREINSTLRGKKYDEKKFWKDITGHTVEELWKDYTKAFNNGEHGEKGGKNQNGDTILAETESDDEDLRMALALSLQDQKPEEAAVPEVIKIVHALT